MLKAFLLLVEKILGLGCSLEEELVFNVCQDLNLVLSTEKVRRRREEGQSLKSYICTYRFQ